MGKFCFYIPPYSTNFNILPKGEALLKGLNPPLQALTNVHLHWKHSQKAAKSSKDLEEEW